MDDAHGGRRALRNAVCREPLNSLAGHSPVVMLMSSGFGDHQAGKAFVERRAGSAQSTAGALREWCCQHRAVYQGPAMIEFIDALPKRGAGKVMSRTLQECETLQRRQESVIYDWRSH